MIGARIIVGFYKTDAGIASINAASILKYVFNELQK